jgi:hypothetical protein
VDFRRQEFAEEPLGLALAQLRFEVPPINGLKEDQGQEGERQEALDGRGAVPEDGIGVPAVDQFVEAVIPDIPAPWTKKHRQFTERAAPADRLLEQVRTAPGPIVVRCFPRQRLIAEEAVRLAAPDALPRLVWDGAPCRER